MKTLIVAVAFATVAAAPAFAQSTNFWSWKGASAAPASATSAYAYAGPLNGPGRIILRGRTYPRNCNVSPASPGYRSNCN